MEKKDKIPLPPKEKNSVCKIFSYRRQFPKFLSNYPDDLNIQSPLASFLRWEAQHPDRLFLRQPIRGEWTNYSYGETGRYARKVANYLKRNLPPGSKVAILSKNCAEWIIADLAIMMAGHVSVPIYPTLSAQSIKPLLQHSEAKLIFIGKLDFFDVQADALSGELLRVSFDIYGQNLGTTLSAIEQNEAELNEIAEPKGDDLASIMYSSGTTGSPKGVMLSHKAFGFVGEKVAEGLKIVKPERFFSYLPLSHIAERALMEMVVFFTGSSISFTESLEKFADNLEQEQPTIFGGVPRIYSKFQEGVLRKLPQKKLDALLGIPILNIFIRRAIQRKMGLSKARVIVSGAAPIPVTLLVWFKKLGIDIREVYGMTENTAFSHANSGKIKIGTVGQPWLDTECKISEEGEILIRNHALMEGYFKDPATTAEVFTDEGFLRTGDKGEIDAEGFLTITGRVKDQFKTDKAKFIAPAKIEMLLLSNPDIEQACAVGIGLPQPIALVVLSPAALLKEKNEANEGLAKTFEQVNAALESYEKIEKIIIAAESWSIENGMLTPSLKLKRSEIERKYQSRYLAWYGSEAKILWEAD